MNAFFSCFWFLCNPLLPINRLLGIWILRNIGPISKLSILGMIGDEVYSYLENHSQTCLSCTCKSICRNWILHTWQLINHIWSHAVIFAFNYYIVWVDFCAYFINILRTNTSQASLNNKKQVASMTVIPQNSWSKHLGY